MTERICLSLESVSICIDARVALRVFNRGDNKTRDSEAYRGSNLHLALSSIVSANFREPFSLSPRVSPVRRISHSRTHDGEVRDPTRNPACLLVGSRAVRHSRTHPCRTVEGVSRFSSIHRPCSVSPLKVE